jgi:hypothetical protein
LGEQPRKDGDPISTPVLDQLKSRLTFIDDPNWATRDAVEKTLIVISETTGAVLTVYQKLRGNPVQQAELAAAIRSLYADLIAPLDIPGVGPMIEAIIDGQLPNVLAGMVGPADAALDKVLPNPAE